MLGFLSYEIFIIHAFRKSVAALELDQYELELDQYDLDRTVIDI
jgi:hypothetical protein